MKRTLYTALGVFALVGIGLVIINYYSYIFSVTVTGKIEDVQNVGSSINLLGSTALNSPQNKNGIIPYFAVAIRTADGEIKTASAEDRQWALAKPGQCVIARYFPYPPWELQKSGTFFGARLLELSDCKK